MTTHTRTGQYILRSDRNVSRDFAIEEYLFLQLSVGLSYLRVRIQNGTCPEQVKTRNNLLLRSFVKHSCCQATSQFFALKYKVTLYNATDVNHKVTSVCT